MRKKDNKKIEAIKQAVIELSRQEGLSNLTTARIAKRAGVSPATIYLNYEDKTDLLSKVYQEVKVKLEGNLKSVINTDTSLEDQIVATLGFTVSQYKAYPDLATFMGLMWQNQDFLDDETVKISNTLNDSLKQLFERIKASPKYTNTSFEVLESFFTIPTSILMRNHFELTEEEEQQVISMVIKAIQK
ncbi:TetR/AcrR family transcriptional regulator [Holzapfeliella sp. He02]|uniref:TetR/AcrR family transcriptional regulator n=1 Tax=Holzapfeliella saturejae TaxID=3082953 RepID=A0ABU8SHT1_9LACO